MARLTGLLVLGLLMAFGTHAYAESRGIYVGGIAGGAIRLDTPLHSSTLGTEKMEFDWGYTFGGFLGYDFGNHFRVETEFSYHENQIRNGGGEDPQASTSVLMVSGFYDFAVIRHDLELYGGFGLGTATAQLETVSLGRVIDEEDNVFAYQLEAGVEWNYNPKTTFSMGYRFLKTADPEFILPSGDRIRMGIESHELILKMRYVFNL